MCLRKQTAAQAAEDPAAEEAALLGGTHRAWRRLQAEPEVQAPGSLPRPRGELRGRGAALRALLLGRRTTVPAHDHLRFNLGTSEKPQFLPARHSFLGGTVSRPRFKSLGSDSCLAIYGHVGHVTQNRFRDHCLNSSSVKWAR